MGKQTPRGADSASGAAGAPTAVSGSPSPALLHDWTRPLPFSVKELKAAIPKKCFQKEYARPLLWVAHDLSIYLALLWFGKNVLHGGGWLLDNPITWFAFAGVVGTVGTGLWVLGHEAGHGALTPSQALNDTIGYVLHQYLMVPYFAWQHSHHVHHSRTNHMDDGETHVPNSLDDVLSDPSFPLRVWMHRNLPRWLNVGIMGGAFFLLGWPLYILFHVSGASHRQAAGANHIDWREKNPLFPNDKIRRKVFLSTVGLVALVITLATLILTGHAMITFKLYVLPLLVTKSWLVGYTFVHHSHPALPHMTAEVWDWLKGAICTVDADYGPLVDYLHHDIGHTHLAHHLFSEMPFFHHREATKAIRAFLDRHGLGHLYTFNTHPFHSMMAGQVELFYADGAGPVKTYHSLDEAIAERERRARATRTA